MTAFPEHRPAGIAREVLTRERCHITELLNGPDHPEVSIARARVEPGVTTELHALAVAETYVIERGEGRMRGADGHSFPVAAGDSVEIAAGCPQAISNTGPDDLVFLCVCRPRFTVDAYTPLEPRATAADA